MSRRIPLLNALRMFEAASRHLSFTKAFDELGATQGAVTRQIRKRLRLFQPRQGAPWCSLRPRQLARACQRPVVRQQVFSCLPPLPAAVSRNSYAGRLVQVHAAAFDAAPHRLDRLVCSGRPATCFRMGQRTGRSRRLLGMEGGRTRCAHGPTLLCRVRHPVRPAFRR